MHLADRTGEGLFVGRHSDKVDMVWHEAVAPYVHGEMCAPFAHESEVGLIVVVGEEGLKASITPLGDMMWQAGSNGSRDSCHKRDDGCRSGAVSIDKPGDTILVFAICKAKSRLVGARAPADG